MTGQYYQRTQLGGKLPQPVLPSGTPVGKITVHDGKKVWIRHVRNKHVLRAKDSYTINAPLLEQLKGHHVYLIRYIAPDAVYEVTLEEFAAKAKLLPRFAQGEDVLSLRRQDWNRKPRNGQLPLPLLEVS